MLKVLIAVPTAKYIEVDTFKSIYDLYIPEHIEPTFQYFYGYNIAQIRNLISCQWAPHFDYVFFVDSDMVFPRHTLAKLLDSDKDIIGGWYIQRKPDQCVAEVYRTYGNGVTYIDYHELLSPRVTEVAGMGFGCMLVKSPVFQKLSRPHFEYHTNLDTTIKESEDANFCRKAREQGFKIWCDTSLLCGHIGKWTFAPPPPAPELPQEPPKEEQTPKSQLKDQLTAPPISIQLKELAAEPLLPAEHIQYLRKLGSQIQPKVIYDIGACVLHWTKVAKEIWPNANIIAFEAMQETDFLYQEANMQYFCGEVLGAEDGGTVEFYQNLSHPGGNSIYKENSTEAEQYFPESSKIRKNVITLNTLVANNYIPLPDLIKIDCQGSELNILKGATDILPYCNDLILELQHTEYNIGAPMDKEVIEWLNGRGFKLVSFFSDNGPDGDYHFQKIIS